MNQLKHKQASVRLNNKTVVIYYSLNGAEMRFPTGVTIGLINKNSFSYVDWDKKTKRLRIPTATTYNKNHISELTQRQNTIDNLLTKANSIINDYFTKDILISPDELRSLLSSQQQERFNKANTGFFEFFEDFLTKKKNHFSTRGNIISIKDYNSTKLLLEDFEAFKSKTLRITDINIFWLNEFVQYCSVPHDTHHGEHKTSSKGQMADSTIKKRLDILSEFFGYLKDSGVLTADDVDTVKAFNKTIRKSPTQKTTLTITEIHQLYKFEFKEPHLEVIRDLFVFLCLTGIRYQDLKQFDRKFIQKAKTGEGVIYKKAASKTGIDYQIPLCKIVVEILEKYNYELPKITDQYGNRVIKDALEETKLFDEYTQQIDKETKQFKRRHEAITLHKGRDSFITNLVDTTPLNELMKYTGHKKLSTLQGYIDKSRPVKMDFIKAFDIDSGIAFSDEGNSSK